jgi:hypothetical protein
MTAKKIDNYLQATQGTLNYYYYYIDNKFQLPKL